MGEGSRGKAWRAATVLAAAAAAAGSTAVFANAGGNGHTVTTTGEPRHARRADLILYDGRISTVDKRNSTVEAIAHPRRRDHGHRHAAGRSRSWPGAGPRSIDLQRPPRAARADRRSYPRHARGLPLLDAGGPARPGHLARHGAGHVQGEGRRAADGRWIWTTSGGWNLNQLDDPTRLHVRRAQRRGAEEPAVDPGQRLHRPAREPGGARPRSGLTAGSPGVTLGPDGKPTGAVTAPATTMTNAAILAQLDQSGIDGEAKCLAGLHRRGQQPRPDGLEGRRRQHAPVGHDRRDQRRACTSKRARCTCTARRA